MLVVRRVRRQCVGWDDAIAAAAFGDRTAAQVQRRYEEITAEVRHVMEEPWVQAQPEWDRPEEPAAAASLPAPVKHAAAGSDGAGVPPPSAGEKAVVEKKRTRQGQKRKKSEPWTEAEHQYMSKVHVPSKTPIQIASHSQKHFNRIATPQEEEHTRHPTSSSSRSCVQLMFTTKNPLVITPPVSDAS
ncbi:hypothetical protein E2562_014040 [Oryza meyeriana var. granulata]|uniref:Uncharacterized protein n=1 Tax=Oryza meyeriana var. granulata TaxID=110450 RepID=A0A6G1DKZ2_9ORYZ|nr:hypothetical protein E2562_014040 [Oryza meyeriana var. granulata]